MADIRKRVGKKGTTYQVRYPSKTTKSGYAFKSFDTLKEARGFTQNIGSLPDEVSSEITDVSQAVQLWLDVCEKIENQWGQINGVRVIDLNQWGQNQWGQSN